MARETIMLFNATKPSKLFWNKVDNNHQRGRLEEDLCWEWNMESRALCEVWVSRDHNTWDFVSVKWEDMKPGFSSPILLSTSLLYSLSYRWSLVPPMVSSQLSCFHVQNTWSAECMKCYMPSRVQHPCVMWSIYRMTYDLSNIQKPLNSLVWGLCSNWPYLIKLAGI